MVGQGAGRRGAWQGAGWQCRRQGQLASKRASCVERISFAFLHCCQYMYMTWLRQLLRSSGQLMTSLLTGTSALKAFALNLLGWWLDGMTADWRRDSIDKKRCQLCADLCIKPSFCKLKSRRAVAEVAVMLKKYSKCGLRIKGRRRTFRKLKISKE